MRELVKTYKVIIHFNRQRQGWTVHYRGQCIPADIVDIKVPTSTVFKPQKKSNPRAWLEAKGVVTIAGMRVIVDSK